VTAHGTAASIKVADLTKRYHLYDRPLDRLLQMAFRGRRTFYRDFWALHGVSFEIPRGCTVGVIGRNGSGKSTLLQILAGTLSPTEGSVAVAGRVSALLELGAGFNPEFTGRENVFLNGAIMGLSREAMTHRFAAIEAFAEIGEFIDQPVKTYSSGMYVRLAFATAINVDPDVLLVDEALAVGDAVFQYRCIRRIKEMQAQGVTILFVSHDLSAVKALCDSAILLERGRLAAQGDPYEVINAYQALIMAGAGADADTGADADADTGADTDADTGAGTDAGADADTGAGTDAGAVRALRGSFRHGNGNAAIADVSVLSPGERPIEVVSSGDEMVVRVRARVNRAVADPVIGIMVRNRLGMDLYGTNTELLGSKLSDAGPGDALEARFQLRCHLGGGDYAVTVAIHTAGGVSCDWIDDAVFFKVLGSKSAEGLVNLHAQVETASVARPADPVDSHV
jgi:ABC-type polysaccharide/polyol phosphate transport system ATPase subunit